MLIVLALAITGFANPGPGGVSLGVFNFGLEWFVTDISCVPA